MTDFPRYAIYYAPPPGSDLDRFGAQLLGYDALNGVDLPYPAGIMEAAPDWPDLTRDPRKYGFHGTLKAPMSLAPGKTEADLFAACAAFAATPRKIPFIRPIVGSISGFIAVIPAEPTPELIRLAADCVSGFDSFRRPLTDADRARRNPSRLTPRQREHLDRWGYPYVMDDFQFHMTLTSRLDSKRREPLLATLRSRFSAAGLEALAIDRIAVFRQNNSDSRFQIAGQYVLAQARD